MKLCDVQVIYPAPEDAALNEDAPCYRNIVCETDLEAEVIAANLHDQAHRRWAGAEFVVVSCKTVLCPSALPEAA
ncbi:hypothetical protein EDC30_102241 [Paucimonas lemoignei]|uniref:Uncharacterized protein n=1 Tax=Paucimonas lemoignei TaxID=29443 RepID=A0A4R3HZ38_PAULE|nr:hypothetical protein [Paucimonas lemoignei]TCS38502.1 hypothetical protein EDC30_102241 [Paucimonas lemoignei]